MPLLPEQTPALRKVQDAFVALIAAKRGDLHLFIDRSDVEPLDESERPGVVMRCVSVEIAPFEYQGQTYWRTLFQLDLHSDNTADATIDLTNQLMLADIVEAMQADRTLGGRLQIFEEDAVSAAGDDGADAGCAIFQVKVDFLTPRGDFRTIVGHGGQTF